MRKDRLLLVLLLTSFALLGAECRQIGQKDKEERKLPQRALAVSSLLRTYYDTITTPAGMYDLKIPEDKDDLAKNGPLEIEFDMGDTIVVNDVRVRLRIAPPPSGNGADCELQCRVIAPDGTTAPWRDLDLATDDIVRAGAEMIFLNEFDGVLSGGKWKVQLRDAADDNDGRCVFRNGTLRLNLGEDGTLSNNVNETASVPLTSTSFSYIREMAGVRDLGDWGHFGLTDRPLRTEFTFTGPSFFVRSFQLIFSLKLPLGVAPDEDIYMLLVAPNGAWQFLRPTSLLVTATFDYGTFRLNTYSFALNSSGITGPSFPFRGQTSSGTWTLYLWDVKYDNNIGYFSPDELRIVSTPDGMGGFIDVLTEFPDTPPRLILAGVN